MRKVIIVAALALVLMTATVGAQDAIEGKALALDGDTILLTKTDGTEVKIRLWAIDAPEMAVWPWGPLARGEMDILALTKDLKAAQEYLGHADIKTTLRYAHHAKGHKLTVMDALSESRNTPEVTERKETK